MRSTAHWILLPWLTGCSSSGVSLILDTAQSDSRQEDSGVQTEVLPSVPETVPDPTGVCQLVLECPGVIPDEPKIDCLLGVTGEDGHTWYEGPAGVERRGRSSGTAPKPQYAVELRDEAGQEQSRDLLGMGGESDWVLHGNYFDRLLMRNMLAYDLFQSFGGPERYAPESAWCELSLNGVYQGVYTLVERIKRDDDRIQLDERIQLVDSGSGDAFVIKHHDSDTLFNLQMTNDGFKLVYPNQETASAEAVARVTDRLRGWENALYSDDPYDPVTGIFAFVDLESAVDIVLLEEFMKNNDAYFLSLHLWQDIDGRIHWVPWDLDLSLGQPSYNDNENPESWVLYRPDIIARMALAPEFSTRMVERWAELRSGPLATEAVLATLDSHQATLGDAIDRNFETWPIEEIDFWGYLYPVSSYAEEDARVRNWIRERLAWMDNAVSTY